MSSFPVDQTHKNDKWYRMSSTAGSVHTAACVQKCWLRFGQLPTVCQYENMRGKDNVRQGRHRFNAPGPPCQAGFNQSALHPPWVSTSQTPLVPTTDTQPASCTSSFNPSAKEDRSSIPTPPQASLFPSTFCSPEPPFHLLLLYSASQSHPLVLTLSFFICHPHSLLPLGALILR